MIKALTNLALNQPKNSFLKLTNLQLFSTRKPSQTNFNLTYPYRFGGRSMQGQFQHNKKSKFFLSMVSQESLFDGFKQAYRTIVHSLAENDVQTLKSTFEPNILSRFKERQVQLINPKAKIEIACGRGLVILDGTFIRTENDQFKHASGDKIVKIIRYLKPQFDPSNLLLDFYYKNYFKSLSSGQNLMKDLTVLYSFEMFFKSKMKLIPKNQSPKAYQNTEEIHSVQFEVENKFKAYELIKKFVGLLKSSEKLNRQKMAHNLFGENYEWKVGDVDRSLGGNLVIIK